MLALLAGALCAPKATAQITSHESRVTPFAPVVPGYRMRFPDDEGSHPDFRIEWWYITGWLEDAGKPLGFQITFFRARPELKHDNPSAFAPRQILIAHAALSDPAHGRLIHAQRAARAGFGLAGADEGRTRVTIDDWRLQQADTSYRAQIGTRDFSLDLAFEATQPPMKQGRDGFSRKGPAPESASYYYSLPHLLVSGSVEREGKTLRVSGSAWLDHEWSSQYLEKDATGWDWIGINLDGGAALMAFRMRDRQGGHYWAGGALRDPNGRLRIFSPDEVRFFPRREWKSARTGTSYPVSFLVRAGDREFAIEPLFDDQEHDTRASTGTIYWEGAVRALRDGKPVGLGYLELTGYWRRLSL
ncbi:MAG: carotenoid 1,2-hydratase [Betaproteobacteria bacterium]|nr:carotenoid 1,2-hydratase [Betaproteobacteria bacterium]